MKSVQSFLKCLLLFLFTFLSVQMFGQWESVNVPGSSTIIKIIKHKNSLFCATANGLFSSNDNGYVWYRKSLRWGIKDIWVDNGVLYASINDRGYYTERGTFSYEYKYLANDDKVCLLKSVDDGNNWQEVRLFPKKSNLPLPFSDVTTLNNKTYLWGIYSTFPRVDSSGLLYRNCDDTCSWKTIYPQGNVRAANFINFKNRLFMRMYIGTTDGKNYTLAKIVNENINIIVNDVENLYFFEKNDTLFLSFKYPKDTTSNKISTDWGQTWISMPSQYKIPNLEIGRSIKKIRNTYYSYDDNNRNGVFSNDLLRWDSLNPVENGEMIYDDGITKLRNSSPQFSRSDDDGNTWKSESSGFNHQSSRDYWSIKPAADGSLILKGYYVLRSENGGLTWQSSDKLAYWDDCIKLKDKFYKFQTPAVYQLIDNNKLRWDSIGKYQQNSYINIIGSRNDTLFSIYDNSALYYSTNLGKNWDRLYLNNNLGQIKKVLIKENIILIIYQDYIVYSNDKVIWIPEKNNLTPFNPAFYIMSDYVTNKDLYYTSGKRYWGDDPFSGNNYVTQNHIEKSYEISKRKKNLTANLITAPKNLSSFLVNDDKIWAVVVAPVASKTNVINALFEVFQSDTSGNSWVKIFEAPNFKEISSIFLNKDTLYIKLNDKEVYSDTSANIYKVAIKDINKTNTKGIVYWDKNKNNAIDSSDVLLNDVLVTRKDIFTKTENEGNYTFFIPSIGDTLKPITPKKFMVSVPTFYLTNLNDTTHNFAIQSPEYQDLSISINTPSVFRPGFETATTITVENRGLKAQNATTKLVLDKKTDFISAVPTATRVNDTLFWNLGLLAIDEVKNIQLKFKTPVTTSRDSFVRLTANILPIEQDSAKADNSDVLVSRVVGSYDPNDKLVEPKTLTPENVKIGVPLEYTIRFQNTGNYPASFVIVEDTLADYFDLSSFRFISSSHKCSYEYKGKGIIRFIFNDINLPDSISNEAGSHGFASFTITPKGTLKKGDVIQNKAFIYFDYNLPIITPISKLTINTPTSIWSPPSVSEGNLKLSPNPAQDILTFDIENPTFKEGSLSIYDLSGRLMLVQNIFNRKETVNISSLGNGEYICVIKSKDNLVFSNKFIKMN